MTSSVELLRSDFATLPELIAAHARDQPDKRALVDSGLTFSYADLHALTSRVASGLQRDGVAQRSPVAIVAATDATSVAVFLGIVQAGCVPSPLAPSATLAQLATMIADSGAPIVFVDAENDALLPPVAARKVRFDDLDRWAPPTGAELEPAAIASRDPFNIIYSSGTTGEPKGIVHSHTMRWRQIKDYAIAGFGDAVTMVSTPAYSNTTLVSLIPTLAYGGTAIILSKFDAQHFLETSERERATHAMLVPVQYQRVMASPDFDRFDLSAYRFKSSTGAPLAADLKADIVQRWPGILLEIYAMTEGGGVCLLWANMYPDKLHTVRQPRPGNDIRLIDDAGNEVSIGGIGEIVGRSDMMMIGYHNRLDVSDATYWTDTNGNRFIRHGDLGRFDKDGFLTLLGRSKDMIISGGFNVYPPDIEAVVLDHPEIADAAVIGVPSTPWGETPHAFYVAREGSAICADEVVAWVNLRVGKTQRLSSAEPIEDLPRSAIGKVLKRELRDRFEATVPAHLNTP